MTTQPSVVAVLSDEHLQLAKLTTELAESSGPLDDLAETVASIVSRHLFAEQRYLYPTVRKLLPDGEQLAEQELSRHHQILSQISELRATPSHTVRFRELANQLRSHVTHHAKCAATEIYPRLMEMTTQEDLVKLGGHLAGAMDRLQGKGYRPKGG
ncbi:hypothetical protein Rhe02_31110 [Rhizocola hellebori]|uniref:Hemerythrin-like domain-containing protein n=1 Tax=Rhizocola hellebori TaxID=1392758 RepID=A0A8J3Q7V9_9ACTN|nr:hemerythrin domain-containing protein [Rhizocola hellebori]GIH05044.1 hypothetical protein Rhe02_31110 [Rhizocola hellebori]